MVPKLRKLVGKRLKLIIYTSVKNVGGRDPRSSPGGGAIF